MRESGARAGSRDAALRCVCALVWSVLLVSLGCSPHGQNSQGDEAVGASAETSKAPGRWPPALMSVVAWAGASDREREECTRWMASRLGTGFTVDSSRLLPDARPTLVHEATGLEFAVVPGDRMRANLDAVEAEDAPFALCRTTLPVSVWSGLGASGPEAPALSLTEDQVHEFCTRHDLDVPTPSQWLRGTGCDTDPDEPGWRPSAGCVQAEVARETSTPDANRLGVFRLLTGVPELVDWHKWWAARHRPGPPRADPLFSGVVECALGAVQGPISEIERIYHWKWGSEEWQLPVGFRPAKYLVGTRR
jgi:hypothetical protein